ncbi:DUF2523 family protein [uncultured Pseudoteredinibacter sp.]|uniref:DUF2523 family protein n=1 Tax=uncultured Pseudoteredinibacter sp. TaxID=1641701 RepID=UPI002635F862|nr:DUF2523 family protein [uncultured Pseudoteredinibacter sp.]
MPLPVVYGALALPSIVAFVVRALVAHAIMRTITALGMTIISFVAIDAAMNQIITYLNRALGAVSGEAQQVASMMGFFDCVNIVMSAYVAAVGIRQIRGAYNRIVFGQSK